jgi:hypothetical protein
VRIESLQHGLLIDIKQIWHETIIGIIRKCSILLAAGAGVDTKYVPQGMRCYNLNVGQLYHAKLGHVLSESTLLPPAPFSFLTTNDWSVHHSPQNKEGVHGSHILIPLVQYVTGYIQKPRYYFDYKPTFPIVLRVPRPIHNIRCRTTGVYLTTN